MVGCPGDRSPSRNMVWLITGSGVWVHLYTELDVWTTSNSEAFLKESISSLRDFIASSMGAWKNPISCLSWMLKVLPRDFSSLLSIFSAMQYLGWVGQFVESLMTKIRNANGHQKW